MGSRAVAVPGDVLEAFLQGKGFARSTWRNEVTYRREVHTCPGVWVVVYTTLSVGGGQTRGCGQDSIKVATVFERPLADPPVRVGLGSEQRVFRTGTVEGVLARMLARMRQAYGEALSMRRCRRCGAPTYPDSGRCVVRACREG